MLDSMLESGIIGIAIAITSIIIALIVYKIKKYNLNQAFKSKAFIPIFVGLMLIFWISLKYLQHSSLYIQEEKTPYKININDEYININGYNLSGKDFKLISELFEVSIYKIEEFDPMYGLWEKRSITPVPLMRRSILKSSNPIYHSIVVNFNHFDSSVILNGKKIKKYMSIEELQKSLKTEFLKQGANRADFKSLIYEKPTRKIFFNFNDGKLTDMEFVLVN